MIYQGLDDEEAGFLNFVHQRQAEMEERQYKEEIQQVKDYRISSPIDIVWCDYLIQCYCRCLCCFVVFVAVDRL